MSGWTVSYYRVGETEPLSVTRHNGPQPMGPTQHYPYNAGSWREHADYAGAAAKVVSVAADEWRIANEIRSTTSIDIGARHDDYPHEFRTTITYLVRIETIPGGFASPEKPPKVSR